MADYTFADTDQGIYEMALTANTPVTIDADSPGYLTLLVHTAPSPVYVQHGTGATNKARTATIALAGTWVDVPGSTDTISLVCASEAVVSVYRT